MSEMQTSPSGLAWWGAALPTGEASWHGFWAQNLRLPGLALLFGLVTAYLVRLLLVKVHLKAAYASASPRGYLWTQLGALGGTNVLGILFGIFLLCSSQGCNRASVLIATLASEAWKVADMADALEISTSSFGHNLDRLYSECPATTHEFLGPSITQRKRELEVGRAALARLEGMLQGLPNLLDTLVHASRSLVVSLAGLQILSLVSLIVCLASAGLVVFLAESSGPKLAKRCSCCQLPCLASVLFAPVLILVAGCAAAELFLAVFSSAMCRQPELAVLNFAQGELGTSPALNLTMEYLHNESTNGAVDSLQVLHTQLSSLDEWVITYGEAIERSCPAWNVANVSQNLRAMIAELQTAKAFLDPTRVSPQWIRLHDLLCNAGISDLIRLILMNLLLGLLCLPLLACGVSCLLEHLVAERGPGGVGYVFNLLSTEDADQSS